MELVKQAYLKGERALFKSHDLKVEDSVFADGTYHFPDQN